MRSRTEWIAKADCKDRHLYRLDARNLGVGVYMASTGGFVGIRTKFGSRFLDEEFHWENDAWGTVKPLEELEALPDGIRLSTDLKGEEHRVLFEWIEACLAK